MNHFKNLAILFFFFVALASCGKDDPTTPQNTTFSNPAPTFGDADGVLVAIQVISYQTVPGAGEIPINADVATAGFFDGNNFFEGGLVSVNSFDLQSLDNNSYVLPGVGSTNIDFDFTTFSGNSWSIGGGADVPMFTHTTADFMPGDVKFVGDYSTVSSSSDLVVTIETAPINTDSILYVVAFGNTTLTRTLGPNNLSATFTAAELSGASGTGVVQVAAYNYEPRIEGGKKYYFINESVISETTTFN